MATSSETSRSRWNAPSDSIASMLVGARTEARNAVLTTLLLLATLLTGCGDDAAEQAEPQVSSKPRGYAGPGTAAPPNQPPAMATPRAPQAPDPYANPFGKRAEAAAEAENKAAEKPRDHSAELLAAIRGAESCVEPRAASQALPSELLVSVEGLVLESGTVVTGSARASVLTPEELQCIKRRLESSRLPPGVKDAPRRVNASLKLTFRASAAPAPDQTGGSLAPAAPTAPAPARPPANPNEDLPEPVAPEDQDPPEAVPLENQDLPEEVLPSQN
jgi:hypothetical protein